MPRRRHRLLAVFALLVALPAVARTTSAQPDPARTTAQRALLHEALLASRHAVQLEHDSLVGAGADLVIGAAREAAFLALGEDHGVAEVPVFAGALFAQLVPLGYRHLAIETSPLVARRLETAAAPGGDAPVLAWQGRRLAHPFEVPFYSWREEAALLERAVSVAGDLAAPGPVLWGVDQEFIGSSRATLAWLADRAPTADARRLADSLAHAAQRGLASAAAGRRDSLFLASVPAELFDRLDGAFPAAEARAVVDDLRHSREVYRLHFAGESYRSNLLREQRMKQTLAAHLADDARSSKGTGKVMIKLGADHLVRGPKLTAPLLSVGAFLSEVALARGSHSYHLLVLGGAGTTSTGVGPDLTFQQSQQPSGSAAWMAPVVAAALPDGWTVFDLRELRALDAGGEVELPSRLRQVVHGYDALVLLSGSTPATFP